MTTIPLTELIDCLQPDLEILETGRRRMDDIWHNRATDSLPIIFAASVPERFPVNDDMRRHVEEQEQMLYDQLLGMLVTALAGSDAQLSLRANTGTGTLATIAGCASLPSEVGLPWTTHTSREVLDAFDPATADIASLGLMPRVQALYTYFRESLPAGVHCYIADTQSPFDLAHLLLGDALFYLLYDEPDFTHALLEKTTTLYIRATEMMKTWIGEERHAGYHATLYLGNGGVRACEDTSTLLSPAIIEEFVLPYQQRALAAFGGGWVHYCGENAALLSGVINSPVARGLNFGNPERYDFAVLLPQLIAAGKFYFGNITRHADEALLAYFRRVIGYTGGTRKGLIFTPTLLPEEAAQPAMVLDCWRSLQ